MQRPLSFCGSVCILFISCIALPAQDGGKTLKWLKITSEQWADAILKANQ